MTPYTSNKLQDVWSLDTYSLHTCSMCLLAIYISCWNNYLYNCAHPRWSHSPCDNYSGGCRLCWYSNAHTNGHQLSIRQCLHTHRGKMRLTVCHSPFDLSFSILYKFCFFFKFVLLFIMQCTHPGTTQSTLNLWIVSFRVFFLVARSSYTGLV